MDEEAATVPPLVDVRVLEQDELLQLSWIAGACEVICASARVQIDPALFNESHSSRRQTYIEPAAIAPSAPGRQASKKRMSRVIDLGREAALTKRLMNANGDWVNTKKREKVVVANGFPSGWTAVAGIVRRNGSCFMTFRDYRSPDGKVWPSFKEASASLVSAFQNASQAAGNGQVLDYLLKLIQGSDREGPSSDSSCPESSKEQEPQQTGQEQGVSEQSGSSTDRLKTYRKTKEPAGEAATGWCDDGCHQCHREINGAIELMVCNWCEMEFHKSCIPSSSEHALPLCGACKR